MKFISSKLIILSYLLCLSIRPAHAQESPDPVIMRGSTVRVQLAAAGEYPLVIAYANIRSIGRRWSPRLFQSIRSCSAPRQRTPMPVNCSSILHCQKRDRRNSGFFQRIPSRSDVEPKPARLFRGYKRYVVHPDEYKGHDAVVKMYPQILKTR